MSRDAAAALLGLSEVSPAVAREAAMVLLGDYDAWEPESVWLSLERDGVTLGEGVQDKLSAAQALVVCASFYYDPVVFFRTVVAFSGHGTHPDALEEPDVAELCYAVEQAGEVLRNAGRDVPEWGSSPPAYAAVLLHRAGFVLPPSTLAFAGDAAPHLPGEESLRSEVRAEWHRVSDAADLAHHEYAETPVGVQVARLAGVELRMRELRAASTAQRSRLS